MNLLYVKYNRGRRLKYQIKTSIYDDNGKKVVIKEGISEKAQDHINKIYYNWKLMSGFYKSYHIEKPELINNKLYCNYEEGVTLAELLQNAARENNQKEIDRLLNLYLDILMNFNNTELIDFEYTNEFKNLFGDIKGLEGTKCLKVSNIDLNMDNIILENNKIKIIDYEWVYDFPIPMDFIIYRNMILLYAKEKKFFNKEIICKYLSSNITLEKLGELYYAFNSLIYKLDEIGLEYSDILTNYRKKDTNINPYNIQLYYKDDENKYSEEKSIKLAIDTEKISTYRFKLHNIFKLKELRLDPIDSYGKFEIISYSFINDKGNQIQLNKHIEIGVISDKKNGEVLCYTTDPQIYFSLEDEIDVDLAYFEITIQYFMKSDYINDIIDKFNSIIDDKEAEISNRENKIAEFEKNNMVLINERAALNNTVALKNKELINKNNEILKIKKEKEAYQKENEVYKKEKEVLESNLILKETELNEILNSTSWKMTKGFRVIGGIMKKNKVIVLGTKTIKSFRNLGIKGTIKKIKLYLDRQNDIRNFQQETGINLCDSVSEEHKVYNAWYEENQDYSSKEPDVKTLAMYLPQFHSFPENDEWWGKGFTEWVNTRKAKPRFKDHYQPREPHEDIGYYDLSDIETLRKQAELAKQHGIYGFCFYYYWFSGKRLMEKPVDMLLEHPEIDINFCLCWANENWTRAWDGQSKSVLISQEYSEQDEINFIKDMKKYIDDKRYIKIEGKPVIIVYNPGQIPNINRAFATWRKCAQELGIGEILIWTCQTSNNTAENLNIEDIIDAEVEFPPHNMWFDIIGERNIDLSGKEACIYNYRKLVEILKKRKFNEGKKPIYRTAMLGWDNAARRENNWVTFYEFSLKSYYDWLTLNINEARKRFKENERFMFINAWNEWAEGTYLEPDKKYGYSYLNTTSKALMDLPFKDDLDIVGNNCEIKQHDNKPRIAMQIHLFYTETIDEIINYVNNIPYDFDCLITTNTKEKSQLIQKAFDDKCRSNRNIIKITPNRGRDVLPLLMQVKDHIDEYDYICHIHSKKTNTSDYGDYWRKYLYNNLLGSSKFISAIIDKFESDKDIGLIFPETYPVLSDMAVWGGNKMCCQQLLEDLKCNIELDSVPVFPVGNMFWFRVDAVRKIFERGYDEFNFPEEQGQVNATLAHGIERLWVYLAKDSGYGYKKMINYTFDDTRVSSKKKIAFFVHYDKNDNLLEEDIYYIKELKKIMKYLVFITNSNLSEDNLNLINQYVDKVIQRENIGFDFGAWKDGLNEVGFKNLESYDELYLINNSCYGPIYDLNTVICDMEEENIDFWGITSFPYSSDGSYLNRDHIDEHIQSYFMVFNKRVFLSKYFKGYWNEMKPLNEFKDAIAEGETKLTHYLKEKGFSYSVYIKECELLMKYLNNYKLIYEKPYYLLVLKCPFVKKKHVEYTDLEEDNRLRFYFSKL